MTRADNSAFLAQANARRHQAALAAARHAIEQLRREGRAVNYAAVAHAAGVSRTWLYRQDQIRDLIGQLRAPATGRRAHRAARKHRLAPPAARHRLRRDHPPANREPLPPRPARPSARPPKNAAGQQSARRAAMTLAPATPETAAMTCPRRRNTYLPGTIHKRLQITAVLAPVGRSSVLFFIGAYLAVLLDGPGVRIWRAVEAARGILGPGNLGGCIGCGNSVSVKGGRRGVAWRFRRDSLQHGRRETGSASRAVGGRDLSGRLPGSAERAVQVIEQAFGLAAGPRAAT